MAGSISLSLSQQFDEFGKPLSGGRLFFIQAWTTSSPQNAFQDTALTLPHPNPLTSDSAGRVPQLYFADGQIKVRLTDRDGVQQLVADNILVVGPSSGGGGGGGVDPTTILQTGQFIQMYGAGVLSGFVRSNGKAIGSATSGATERANADTQPLYLYLWGADPNLAVSGASAAADYAANKTIALPDLRGRVLAGLDDMGSIAAGRLNLFGANSIVLGSPGGQQTSTLLPANLPPYTPSGSVTAVGGSSSNTFTSYTGTVNVQAGGNRIPIVNAGNGAAVITGGTGTFTGTPAPGQISTPVSILPPMMLITIYLKL